MFAGIMVYIQAMTLLLDSTWALIPAGTVLLLYLIGTLQEDRLLHKEPRVYKEHTARVEYRLIFQVW
jgi:protein-S-isoprenylcysteine O-methyltransferase Ste14